MSDPDPTASHAVSATDHHGGGHDSHADEVLGPVDGLMWSVGLLGVAIGLLICFCFASATGVL
jgi:hypothetical protein